ncbi:Oligoribonuclease [Kiritimatiella glycovorans]|uniref:Oligoribonuclease n=2 Tax=Kiritimatiella glycovorans TaxID=1307763 RepID=A0A0G3EEZ2_9BACT|nr:Oligoribonuclease [Kiritimatiella glycovorans]
MKKEKPTPAYVWFDTEYTTLELENARLLQVAAMITDRDLERLHPPEEDFNRCVRLPRNAGLSSWVKRNLAGLIERCRGPEAVPADEIDGLLCDYIDRWLGLPKDEIELRPVLAGNSIHADWFLARRFCPAFLTRMHYRLLDVSALKIQWKDRGEGEELNKSDPQQVARYFPEADVDRAAEHDALYDIKASAAELAYYRERFGI